MPVRSTRNGILVTRPAAADPQNAFLPIFFITGTVFIHFLAGLRTVIQAGGASTIQFQHSNAPTVLDDGSAAITGDDAGTWYVPEIPANPCVVAPDISVANLFQYMAGAGAIEVTMTAAAGTGETMYYLLYTPMDIGSTVTIA